MNSHQQICQAELQVKNIVPRKYHGQIFTSDPIVIDCLVKTVRSVYRPETKIIEIGGGLGHISQRLVGEFDNVEILEIDDDLLKILKEKGLPAHKQDILTYQPPKADYLLVGNIPFHISGKLYRRFMSEIDHKPYGMIFITDKNYAQTLMGQPPRCYRVSLQAQAYGDIEIVADVPPTSVYPEPKIMSCIINITQNNTRLPKNFWSTVNFHWENFPTPQVESPKTMGLKRWIDLCEKSIK
jgi:16S rRNA (adenine1518-N6/adenine1519-N6)-dimethyltransferase